MLGLCSKCWYENVEKTSSPCKYCYCDKNNPYFFSKTWDIPRIVAENKRKSCDMCIHGGTPSYENPCSTCLSSNNKSMFVISGHAMIEKDKHCNSGILPIISW